MIVFLNPNPIPENQGGCETFCHHCGQLRLWLKPEKPTACGNCGSTAIEVDKIMSERLAKLRETFKQGLKK